MRTVIQRVKHASVTIDGEVKGKIEQGLLILLGVQSDDTQEDIDSVMDVDGNCLVVSQFTLMASYKKGNRPSWLKAAPHNISIPLYEAFCKALEAETGKHIETGEFGADMKVELLNDGPVTICMDTKNKE